MRPYCQTENSESDSSLKEHATLGLASRHSALSRGLPRHLRDLGKFQSGDKHGHRRPPSPAVDFPACANEFDFWPEGKVEDHFRASAIKLLRELQQWLGRPC